MYKAYQINDQSRSYFLTFQVVGWADIFTRQVYRDIVIDSMKYCREHKQLNIFAYVIMSNHVHVIFQSKNDQLSATVRDFKKHTAKAILKELDSNKSESRREWLKMIFEYHAKYNMRSKGLQFWTHENHAVELSSNDMVDSRLDYIHNNPVKAGWVEKPEDYLYSSARNYADLEGLIEVDFV